MIPIKLFPVLQDVHEIKCHENSVSRWPLMWYLNRGGRLDMNVQEAWQVMSSLV
jgi:hypothetical protein